VQSGHAARTEGGATILTRSDNGQTRAGYPASWYAATAELPPPRPPLTGAVRADVCVIGGGFTGLSTALNLAERGMNVVLLEAERIGYGASGRNGGLIGSGQRKDVLESEALFGYEKSRLLWDLAEAAKAEIRGRIGQHGIDCDLTDGQLVGIHTRRYAGWARALSEALAERYDYPDTHALDAEATRAMVATDAYIEGFFDVHAATLHPLNFALGLARACEAAGVRVFENSRVTGYARSDPATVSAGPGSVSARFVVLACNGYLGRLEPRVAGKIMPINNFVVATAPLGEERAGRLISGRYGVHDTRFVVNYYRLTHDYRLLFGGGENYRHGFPRDIARFVRPYLLRVFPQLADVPVEYSWGGTLSVTVNRLPHIGRLPPNLYFAQGYSGHGISTATFAGKLIAEAIAGTAGRFDVFASLPTHTFPGGTLLRYPGMVLGMLWYGLKDRL
jgi:gamma-glutamylputrescine oxidase